MMVASFSSFSILQFTLTRGSSGFGFTVTGYSPVQVGRVDSSSMAFSAGLCAGDFIVRINGQNVSRSRAESVAKLVKVSKTMVLDIQRAGEKRENVSSGIDVNSVEDETIYEDTICHTPRGIPEGSCHKTPSSVARRRISMVSARSPLGEITNSPSWKQCVAAKNRQPSSDLGTSIDNSFDSESEYESDPLNDAQLSNSSSDEEEIYENYISRCPTKKLRTSYEDRTSVCYAERRAAIYRLWRCEADFVQMMSSGIQRYSRPLRHCIISSVEHKALFQNVEKVFFLLFS